MKRYVRFFHEESIKYGLINEDKIEVLKGKSFAEFDRSNIFIKLEDVELLSPCTPQKVICVGLNYSDTVLEEGMDYPEEPLLFLKSPSSIITSGKQIIKNNMVDTLACEVELGVVIGKQGKHIPIEDAYSHIWGFIVANDITAKDLQKQDVQWARAKSFDTFLPIGYEIVRDMENKELQLTTTINGQVVQSGNTKDMIFDIACLINYISHVMTLYEGDIILSGTPGGYGKIIKHGDEVISEIEEVGSITNTVKESSEKWCLK